MTTAKELNEAIKAGDITDDEGDAIEWADCVRWERDAVTSYGTLAWVDAFRDPDEPGNWIVLFAFGDLLYAVYGSYDSWNGVDFYDYDLSPVEAVKVETTVYRRRKES